MRNCKKNQVLTDEELQQWNDLYEYVRTEILRYDRNQSLPSGFVLRLKGLTKGKYLENKNIEDKANYSYQVILCTFKICKPQIMNAIAMKDFKNEQNKFNYICKIVEGNINDVYMRLKKKDDQKRKAAEVNTDVFSHTGASYMTQTEQKINKRLENLW